MLLELHWPVSPVPFLWRHDVYDASSCKEPHLHVRPWWRVRFHHQLSAGRGWGFLEKKSLRPIRPEGIQGWAGTECRGCCWNRTQAQVNGAIEIWFVRPCVVLVRSHRTPLSQEGKRTLAAAGGWSRPTWQQRGWRDGIWPLCAAGPKLEGEKSRLFLVFGTRTPP